MLKTDNFVCVSLRVTLDDSNEEKSERDEAR